MAETEFLPPIAKHEIASVSDNEAGDIVSATVLISDANSKLFSLHVEAQGTLQPSDAGEEPGDTLEPIFIAPDTTISADVIDQILKEVGSGLLSEYLVPQENPE